MMPAMTLVLKPPNVNKSPRQVVSCFSIDSTQVEGGLAEMEEVDAVKLSRSDWLCAIAEGSTLAGERPLLPKSDSL